MDNWLVRARKASGLSPEVCADRLARTLSDYLFLEEHPGQITLNELSAFCRACNDESRRIVWNWLHEFEVR